MGSFQPGNKYGKGRPKISLNKPELLLPVIFQKHRINWAEDFGRLYKASRIRELTKAEYHQYKTLQELLPYLCTKISVKDLDASKFVTEGDKQAMTDQTAALLEALENVNSKPTSPDKKTGMADGPTSIPPTA
jgi:hypothetical protein